MALVEKRGVWCVELGEGPSPRLSLSRVMIISLSGGAERGQLALTISALRFTVPHPFRRRSGLLSIYVRDSLVMMRLNINTLICMYICK